MELLINTLLIGIATNYITTAIIKKDFFYELRKFVIVRWGGAFPRGVALFELLEENRLEETRRNWISKLLYCHFCLSFWTALLISLLTAEFSSGIIITTLGGAWISSTLNEFKEHKT